MTLGSSGNTIGGLTAAARNVISGNGIWGVILVGADVDGNEIIGNYIGVKASGKNAVRDIKTM